MKTYHSLLEPKIRSVQVSAKQVCHMKWLAAAKTRNSGYSGEEVKLDDGR